MLPAHELLRNYLDYQSLSRFHSVYVLMILSLLNSCHISVRVVILVVVLYLHIICKCSILHLVVVVNLFLCPNYELNFIVIIHVWRTKIYMNYVWFHTVCVSVILALRAYSLVDNRGRTIRNFKKSE